MKTLFTLVLTMCLFAVMFGTGHLLYTYSFRATERYPEDVLLPSATNKVALVIVAHDDDAATMAGTMAFLRSQGWTIDFLCFYRGQDAAMDQLRRVEAQQAARIQGFRQVSLVELDMQKKPLVTLSIPYAEFDSTFRVDSIASVINTHIQRSQPSLLLTLDDVIGGYGHAEHVLVSQLAVRCARQSNSIGASAVKWAYQCVYPASMGERMMLNLKLYQDSKKVYNCDGMPAPNISITISSYSAEKMATLNAYASQQRNLKKFVKHYNLYPHWLYFSIFDKEYFRVVPVDATGHA